VRLRRQIALWDAVALLALFDEVNKSSRVDGALKIQKLPFLAELEGQRQGLAVASFPFIRYHYGPYSAVLQEDVSRMQSLGLIAPSSGAPTRKGRYILEVAQDNIKKSPDAEMAISILRDIAQRYGRWSGSRLKEHVYRLTVPVRDAGGQLMVVKKIPHCFQIITPAAEPNLRQVDPFDDDTRTEINSEIMMDDSVLDRTSPTYRRTISDALSRLAETCS